MSFKTHAGLSRAANRSNRQGVDQAACLGFAGITTSPQRMKAFQLELSHLSRAQPLTSQSPSASAGTLMRHLLVLTTTGCCMAWAGRPSSQPRPGVWHLKCKPCSCAHTRHKLKTCSGMNWIVCKECATALLWETALLMPAAKVDSSVLCRADLERL